MNVKLNQALLVLTVLLASVTTLCGCKEKTRSESSSGSDSASSDEVKVRPLNKKRSAMMEMNGMKIVRGIIVANMDRMRNGKPMVWPHNDENDGKSNNAKDIAGKSYGTSTDYFKELFDIQHQTDGDYWRPYVEDYEPGWLSCDVVAPHQPGDIRPENNAWIVVSGVTDELGTFMPVLISSNVDVSGFPTSGQHDMSTETARIKLGRNGSPLGEDYAVIVYKGGRSKTFRAEELTLQNIYDARTFTIPNQIKLRYLKP